MTTEEEGRKAEAGDRGPAAAGQGAAGRRARAGAAAGPEPAGRRAEAGERFSRRRFQEEVAGELGVDLSQPGPEPPEGRHPPRRRRRPDTQA
ncbi:MAG: hypothetical protein K6T75_09415 [Acetobacteraceae bacterium]|nr:hypothetical protein [Acetobacteraceae bacterium]